MADPLGKLKPRLRQIINDPAESETAVFDDVELEVFLDAHALAFESLALTAETSTTFITTYGNWGDDATFADGAGAALTPTSGSNLAGRWVFAAAPSAVSITGRSFDLHSAAADALEEWATKLALSFDFTADGATYHLSQRREALLKAASEQRSIARPVVALWVRTDLA
jgi:hypothetical protein